MRIFVTGGSGFLGKRLITRLVQENHQVSALARSEQSQEVVRSLGATPILGSLETVADWKEHLKQQEAVIHCAAPVEFWGPWEKFYRESTLATRNLMEAAHEMGVKRFLYVSSESVLIDREPLLNIDETAPYALEPNSFYGKSKKLAEEAILAFPTEMVCLIFRPTFIWGKGVPALEEIMQKVRSKEFMWVSQGQIMIEHVHIENVVEALCLGLIRGHTKEIYLVTNDQAITVRELLTKLLKTQGVEVPSKSVPNGLARFLAGFLENLWKGLHLKGKPPLSRFEWSFVGLPRQYNISKIKKELGYTPKVSLEKGLEEMTL